MRGCQKQMDPVYCVERAVALRCRSFASRLASPANERRSADQRGKLWAQGF